MHQVEKLARAYVEHCGDVPAALRDVAPAIADKTDKALIAHFDKMYKQLPEFWVHVKKYTDMVKERVALNADDLLQRWTQQATADLTELVQVVREPCPYCYPLAEGGMRPPLPALACPSCGGKGVTMVDVTETRLLSPTAKMMFLGAEMGKYGVKVKLADPRDAEDRLARALSLFVPKTAGEGDNGQSLTAPPLPDDQNEASKIYSNWVRGT